MEFYIWDTAGQEEYNSLTRRYYKGASACIIAFSTVDRESFNHVERWKKAVEDECGTIPMIIVQTKIDLADNAAMSAHEAELLAKETQLPLFKVCSKDGLMVNELFEFLAVRYFSKDLQKEEGRAPTQSLREIPEKKAIKLASTRKDDEEGDQKLKKKKWVSKCSVL